MIDVQQLIKESVLHMDFRDGSFRDKSGNGNDGVGTSVSFTNNGLNFQPSGGLVAVTDSPELQLTAGTLVVYNYDGFTKQEDQTRFIAKRDAGGTNWDWSLETGTDKLSLYDGSNSRTISTSIIGTKFQAVTFRSGEIPEGWVDGISIGAYNALVTVTADDAALQIGNNPVTSTRSINQSMQGAIIFPRKLTASEISALYSYLESLHFDTKVKTISNANIVVKPETTLIAGYNMKPEGGVLVDQSENSFDGTPVCIAYEKHLIGDFARFNGIDSEINLGNDPKLAPGSAENFTVSMWIRHEGAVSDFNGLYGKTDGGLGSDSGFALYTRNNDITIIYNDGSVTSISEATTTDVLPVNTMNHIVMTANKSGGNVLKVYVNGETVINTPITRLGSWDKVGNDALIGALKSNTWNFEGLIGNVKIYNEEKSQDWVQSEYNKGKAAGFQTESGVYESVANQTEQIENTPFKIDSGAFKITRDSIDGTLYDINQLVDGDMEAVSTSAWASTDATLSKVVSDLSGSSQALRITATGATFWARQTIISSGKTYRISGYARSDGAASVRILNADTSAVWAGTTSTDWQEFDETFVGGADGNIFLGSPSASGYVEFDNVSVQEVEKDVKVIECVTDGLCYIPTSYFKQTLTEAAYGKWEFWCYKALDANALDIMLNAKFIGGKTAVDQNGWSIALSFDERVIMGRSLAGSYADVSRSYINYVNTNQWYKITVTRSASSEFTFYIDDILVPMENGTNPFTNVIFGTSSYMVFDLDAGDKIAYSDSKGQYGIIKRLV